MKKTSMLLLILAMTAGVANAKTTNRIDSLLTVLDNELARSNEYIAMREHSIDSAKTEFRIHSDVDAAIAVGQLYAPYQCDSAIAWFARAVEINKGELAEENQIIYNRCLGRSDGHDVPFKHDSVFVDDHSHQYAINACYYAMDLLARGDTTGCIELMARSAITDVRLAVMDNAAIWMLAQLLYTQGHIERSYYYIEQSCMNADRYNAKLRYMQILPIANGIATTYQAKIRKLAHHLTIATIAAVIAFLICVIAALFTLHQNKQLHRLNKNLSDANTNLATTNKQLDLANQQLSEMNHIREQYICLYLEEKSADIRRLYKEALKAGSPDSEEKFKQRLEAYYRSFDTTFLRLYPNFVGQINGLLRLDSQITPPKGSLTPELRIFALIRLGINKSTRISELLCLSANTVYNYRSRVKNLYTGNRDEFEDIVRNL